MWDTKFEGQIGRLGVNPPTFPGNFNTLVIPSTYSTDSGLKHSHAELALAIRIPNDPNLRFELTATETDRQTEIKKKQTEIERQRQIGND